ncbi:nucleoside deaminase [Nakamurella endophytica]|uniref:Guanine deaminase n=1 Tax=Nakamurella endophytica TaxID=1748367 RepID=A0A917T4R3_9ACTN|nr:nucleoside deaminase [Nakamurella endophytica]GGM11094.1 guanine deaminase [Nakamurella endophytica]
MTRSVATGRPDPMAPFQAAFLDRALVLAAEGAAAGKGGPFGAVVVRDGAVVAEGCNQVLADNDPTAHAEVTAIRRACAALSTFQLDGCQIYSSCEPCPMCLGAVYWARPQVLYFAADREDAAFGDFDDAFIYRELATAAAERTIPFVQVPHGSARDLFVQWKAKTDRTPY